MGKPRWIGDISRVMASEDEQKDSEGVKVVFEFGGRRTPSGTALPVPEGIRGLLCALVYGWTPSQPSLGRVDRVWFGEAELSDLEPSIRSDGARLVIEFNAASARSKLDALMPFDFKSRVHGSMEGGATFEVEWIGHLERAGGFSATDGVRASLTIETDDWNLLGGNVPSVWVGRVEGLGKISHGGNLVVERLKGDIRGGRRRHFRLQGAYLYYLVRSVTDGEWWLVVDTGAAGRPDWELLGRDLLILQFVFGRQLRLPFLLGLNADRSTTAYVARTAPRKNLQGESYPPVPIERNNDHFVDEAWAVLLFERIGASWRERPNMNMTFWMALDMYLDAMTNHLDADYMRLQIALEAFAYSLLKKNDEERADVKDKTAWKEWVKGNKNVIVSYATPGREDALYQKVLGTYRLSSGRVVPTAFVESELILTAEMSEELEGRDFAIHQGLMSPEGYEVDRDMRRIAMVRTMLISLVAKCVGYGGAINGWEVGRLGHPMEPDPWWSVSEGDRAAAQTRYLAEEVIT